MINDPTFRWLGIAGIELRAGNKVLVVDPYFSRISFWKMWAGRIQPDQALIQEKIQICDYLLVTHAHYDHLMDAPVVARHTGAVVYGSANTCQILKILGVPPPQIQEIHNGNQLTLGPFYVRVIPGKHRKLPIFTPGDLSPNLKPPLRALDYRMDTQSSFHITLDGCTILTDPGPDPNQAPRADVLWLHPMYSDTHLQDVVRRVHPKLVIPYHWDDLWQPLGEPLRPTIQPPALTFPPFRKVSLRHFKQVIEQADPGIQVVLPELFVSYPLHIW